MDLIFLGIAVSNNGDYIHFNSSDNHFAITVREKHSSIEIFLSPECRYSLSISLSSSEIIQTLHEIFIPKLIPSHLIAFYIMLLANIMRSRENCSMIYYIFSVSPVIMVLSSRVMVYILHGANISSDMDTLDEQGMGVPFEFSMYLTKLIETI